MAKKNRNMIKQSLTHFYDKEYIKYAIYSAEERAIPSILDGMKPSYRKSLHAALSFMKKGQSVSGLEIVGETYKKSNYHHGDSSLADVITNHGASYLSNSAPLDVNGSGGDLRNTEASAIRYLKFTLNNNIDLYNIDLDILEHKYDGDKKLEPCFYLPLIPLVLASRSSGTATGFAFSNNMSFSLKSITEATIKELENITKNRCVELPTLEPYVQGYDGKFTHVGDGKWQTESKYKIQGKKVIIEGLPIEQTYDSFESNLAKLVDTEKILNFTNESTKGSIKYVVHFNQTVLNNLTKKGNARLEKLLKIVSASHKNTYTFLDENGLIMDDLENESDVIKYFTKYRLSRYKDRKKLLISNIKKDIEKATNLSRFIEMVVNGKLEMRNRPIKEIKSVLTKEKINHEVLQVRLTRITKEEYEKLKKEILASEKELEKIKKTPIEKMYLTDLKELLKKY